MPITVTIPGVGDVDFPDSMSQSDVTTAVKKLSDAAQNQPHMTPAPAGTIKTKKSAGPFDDSQFSGAFFPGPKEFAERAVNAVADDSVGTLKTIAKIPQMIPGVASAQDAAFGLPKGASAAATAYANPTQELGGALTTAALGAQLPAGSESVMGRNAAGQFSGMTDSPVTLGSRLVDLGQSALQKGKDAEAAASAFVKAHPVASAALGIGGVKMLPKDYVMSAIKTLLGL